MQKPERKKTNLTQSNHVCSPCSEHHGSVHNPQPQNKTWVLQEAALLFPALPAFHIAPYG